MLLVPGTSGARRGGVTHEARARPWLPLDADAGAGAAGVVRGRGCDGQACHALPALRDHSQAEALQREDDIGGCQVLVLARGERGGARRLLGRPSRAGLLRRAGWGY